MIWLVAASLLWAFSFGLIKGQLSGYDPVAVSALRLVLAAAVFAPFWLRSNLERPLVRRALGLGVVQFGLMYVLYIASYQWLAAWQVAALTVFTPLYVVILWATVNRAWRPRHALAGALAVAGALIVTGAAGGADWRGVALLQAANVCFAVGQLGYRDLRRRAGGRDAALVGWMHAGAAAAVLAAALLKDAGALAGAVSWPGAARLSLLYLGLLPTGLGFYLWNRGAARTGAGLLAVANNLKVPLAVLVSWLVFGEETPYLKVAAGLVVVLGALAVAGPADADEAG